MELKIRRHALSLALAAGALGSVAWSPASNACPAEPLIGSVCIVAYPTRGCPSGYVAADGRTLTISQNTPLYSLIGITFGGDGQSTFNAPDLRGRVPVGAGFATPNTPDTPGTSTVIVGQKRGQESVQLAANNLPQHTHDAAFTPTTGAVSVTIPAQPASGSITATASTDIVPGFSGAVDPAPNVPNYYLTGVTSSVAGPVTTNTPGANKSTLIGTNVKVDASTFKPAIAEQKANILNVTGGSVAVGANPTYNTPVSTLPPELGLYFCIATQGTYPLFD